MKFYSTSVEQDMRKFYNTLSEKDKRRYAAIEALKLGHGGVTYISRVLGCSQKTVSQGIKEIKELPKDGDNDERVRKRGGGRKGYEESISEVDEKFLDTLKDHTAGDPMQTDVSISASNFRYQVMP